MITSSPRESVPSPLKRGLGHKNRDAFDASLQLLYLRYVARGRQGLETFSLAMRPWKGSPYEFTSPLRRRPSQQRTPLKWSLAAILHKKIPFLAGSFFESFILKPKFSFIYTQKHNPHYLQKPLTVKRFFDEHVPACLEAFSFI